MRSITSVNGIIPCNSTGITDAHNHVWIDSLAGVDPKYPVLNDFSTIVRELVEYKDAGGTALVDCQPGGCGRNGCVLAKLAQVSGVSIISATGFHRSVYYPTDFWLWKSTEEKISDFFFQEIMEGEYETLNSELPVRAGFIKIACEDNLEKTFQPAMRAAANTARQTNRGIEIHTEKGQSAIEIVSFFLRSGVNPEKILVCHIDKRPDYGLHRELAQAGVLLEYDTFFREKYQPEINLWPLLIRMIAAGFEDHICLATDMAEQEYWHYFGHGPGLRAFPAQIKDRLEKMDIAVGTAQKLMGENICRFLAIESSVG